MKNQKLLLNETNLLRKTNHSFVNEMDVLKEFKISPITNIGGAASFLGKENKPYTESIIKRSVGKDRIEIW